MSDSNSAFQEFLQKSNYAEWKLLETGIDFSKIKKSDLLMTCSNYSGTIAKGNYDAILEAVDQIYERINCYENA